MPSKEEMKQYLSQHGPVKIHAYVSESGSVELFGLHAEVAGKVLDRPCDRVAGKNHLSLTKEEWRSCLDSLAKFDFDCVTVDLKAIFESRHVRFRGAHSKVAGDVLGISGLRDDGTGMQADGSLLLHRDQWCNDCRKLEDAGLVVTHA